MQCFINEDMLEPEHHVLAVPLFRKNELYAFFEIPAMNLDRYADRSIGLGIFPNPLPMMAILPNPGPVHPGAVAAKPQERVIRRRRSKAKEVPCDQCKDARSPEGDPKLPEVPTRARKKKRGSGGGE